jgi:hypothetical protein
LENGLEEELLEAIIIIINTIRVTTTTTLLLVREGESRRARYRVFISLKALSYLAN